MNARKRFLLRHKYPRVISELSELAGISLRQAMGMLYTSDVYKDMSEGVSDMHCRSDRYLAEEIRREFAVPSPSGTVADGGL
jgi:hypothetical protein